MGNLILDQQGHSLYLFLPWHLPTSRRECELLVIHVSGNLRRSQDLQDLQNLQDQDLQDSMKQTRCCCTRGPGATEVTHYWHVRYPS